jgi:hypothetical protein
MTTTAPGARTAAVPARRRRTRLVFGGGVLALLLALLAGTWVGALPLPPGAVVDIASRWGPRVADFAESVADALKG